VPALEQVREYCGRFSQGFASDRNVDFVHRARVMADKRLSDGLWNPGFVQEGRGRPAQGMEAERVDGPGAGPGFT
jgi:hypothetical protein